ncbi:putative Flagellar hook-associated protein 3 [Syntrophobacter sp. SbD1]|nr:putative Flagellar hook-associated protein 3 [Syntrophobacter sp. SbD1]
MRITLNMQDAQSLLTLNNQQEQITQLSQQISSGQQMSAPSDDPYSWAQAMNTQQGLREYTSIQSNISFATGWEQATSSALSQLSSLVSQAKQVAISASSASGTTESAAYVTEVNGILQQALNLGNTQYNGQYIFAGAATGTSPFSVDSSTGAVTLNPLCTGSINVRTSLNNGSSGSTSAINITGDDIFTYSSGGSTLNVLSEIQGLGQAIQSGDSAAISNSITTLGDAFNNVNNQSEVEGARLSELTTQQSALNVFQTNDKGQLSNLQDTDMAAATTKLQAVQTAFQAALQVTTKVTNLNLASILTGSTG